VYAGFAALGEIGERIGPGYRNIVQGTAGLLLIGGAGVEGLRGVYTETTGPIGSPNIAPEEINGKTRSQIQKPANKKRLGPKGDKSAADYPRKWSDPVTGEPRLRLDRGHIDTATGKPYKNPNAAQDHVHAYEIDGTPIEVNGDKHIPTVGE